MTKTDYVYIEKKLDADLCPASNDEVTIPDGEPQYVYYRQIKLWEKG